MAGGKPSKLAEAVDMKDRLSIIALALGLVTVTAPTSVAYHLSAGGEETIGTGAVEDTDNPSVEGKDAGEAGTPYGIGTTPSSECYEAKGAADPSEATTAATAQGLCGDLLYNEGHGVYERPSPPDQTYYDPLSDLTVGQFDVQRVSYVGALTLVSCVPICDDSSGLGVQDTVWDGFHTAGAAAGLTQGPEEADENNEGDRDQVYSQSLLLGSAPGIVQRNTGLWEMNGWQIPYAIESFVGFLEDADGDPISADRLEQAVKPLVGTEMSEETRPRVCGYRPNADYVSTGEETICEISMTYVGNDESAENHGDAPFGSYNDPCQSPTYTCGEISGEYWESTSPGLAAYGGLEQLDQVIWHWVVAPNARDCGNTQPGFDLDGDGTGTPFLAHDVDVYTQATAVRGAPQVSPEGVDSYRAAVANASVVPALSEEHTYRIEDDVLEPNHVGAEASPIDDNSRDPDIVTAERTATTCQELASSETEQTRDPWVNYVDSGVIGNREAGARSAYQDQTVAVGPLGLYDDSSTQDEDNDDTTDAYRTQGFVGIFADANDDGDYDRVTGYGDSLMFGDAVYERDKIESVGAYPMLWDMKVEVDETGDAKVDTTKGCEAFLNEPFAETMKAADYGPNTGIAQAVFLSEPTTFSPVSKADVNAGNPDARTYGDGNNIYLLTNQAGRTLWDGDASADNGHALDAEIDALVNELETYVVNNHGVDPSTVDVHQPGADLGLDTDYGSQCGESTGGFDSQLSFTHTCEAGCEGDTIATMYAFEVTNDVGTIGGGGVPYFTVNGERYDGFSTSGLNTWFDLDAFDGNADRVEQRQPAPPAK